MRRQLIFHNDLKGTLLVTRFHTDHRILVIVSLLGKFARKDSSFKFEDSRSVFGNDKFGVLVLRDKGSDVVFDLPPDVSVKVDLFPGFRLERQIPDELVFLSADST